MKSSGGRYATIKMADKAKELRNINKKRSIPARWFFNSLGVTVILMIAFITVLSFSIQSYVYNGIQQVLIGRSDELLNIFLSSGTSNFATVSRAYIENFPDKNDMEIMALSKDGEILISSTGFSPNQNQTKPDYDDAIANDTDFGYWIGHLETGEKVMAISNLVRNREGALQGSLRYIVSMEKADEQIQVFVMGLIFIGFGITLAISLSGIYFIRSIVNPLKQINLTALKISQGDFAVRIKKINSDEIGQLIDTINAMAEELGTTEKTKNDFVSSISHELRTPLTAIKGWAETLHNEKYDEETTKQGMNIIMKESQRLTLIVEDLLDFSNVRTGKMILSLEKTDILNELDEVVFLFTKRAGDEKKLLIYEEVESLSPIMADMNRLKQVFVNIIDNALKYTNENGTITISAYQKNDKVYIEVKDTGVGIDPKHLPKIKEKFYKANQMVRGSGIGLAVADEIVTLHAGKLLIDSVWEQGTTVTVELPICKDESNN